MLQRLTSFASSSKFLHIIIAIFVLSSAWIALSSTFPLAFDEEVHYGMIQIYASQPLPWAVEQTTAANAYGSITTDPSYLYYLLMSLPYHLLNFVTDSQIVIVTCLRFINIAIVVAALYLYGRLLLTLGLSRPAANLLIALFTLIPVMPLLAGQINYDNLFLLMMPGLFLAALSIREQALKGRLAVPALLVASLIIIYGSIVKYAFLPIAVATGLYIVVTLWLAARKHPKMLSDARVSIRRISRPVLIASIALLVIGAGLFGQRYGRNLVVYQDPVPDCGVVLSVDECMAWGPWRRDYNLAQSKTSSQEVRGVFHYTTTHWAFGMWNRLFFTVAGPENSYATRQRLPVVSYSFIIFGVIGIVAALIYARPLVRKHPGFVLILVAGGLYTAILISQQYALYAKTAQPVAINGRYLLPFLPLFGAIIAAGYQRLFTKLRAAALLPAIGLIALFLFTQGGGITAYLIRSESAWLYQNQIIQAYAHDLKTISKFLVIGD